MTRLSDSNGKRSCQFLWILLLVTYQIDGNLKFPTTIVQNTGVVNNNIQSLKGFICFLERPCNINNKKFWKALVTCTLIYVFHLFVRLAKMLNTRMRTLLCDLIKVTMYIKPLAERCHIQPKSFVPSPYLKRIMLHAKFVGTFIGFPWTMIHRVR